MSASRELADVVSASPSTDLNVDNGTLVVDVSTNRVGIGTTAPSTLLHMERSSTTAYSGTATTNDSTALILNTGANGHATLQFQTLSSGTAQTGQATISSFNESSGSKNTAITFGTRQNSDGSIIERMRIASDGKVGIGTTSPDSLLEIRGSAAEFKIDDTDSGAQITLRGNVSSDTVMGQLSFYNNTDNDTLATIRVNREGANDAANITFYTQATGSNNVERMRISSTGKVGIGTDAPESLFHVDEGTGTNGFILDSGVRRLKIVGSNSGTGYVSLDVTDQDGTNASSRNLILEQSGGKVGIGTTTPGALTTIGSTTLNNSGDTPLGKTASTNPAILINNSSHVNSESQILFGYNTGSQTYAAVSISYKNTDAGNVGKGDLLFALRDVNTDSVPVERMRITSAGLVGLGLTVPDYTVQVPDQKAFGTAVGYMKGHTVTLTDGSAFDCMYFRKDDGVTTLVGAVCGTLYVTGTQSSNVSSSVYTVRSTSNGTSDASITLISGHQNVRNSNPVNTPTIVADGGSGGIKIRITRAVSANVAVRCLFVGVTFS